MEVIVAELVEDSAQEEHNAKAAKQREDVLFERRYF
jgi:hypothetical protein